MLIDNIIHFTDLIWNYLWVFILISSLVGWWGIFKIKNSNHTMNEEEKKNNNNLFFISMAGSIGLGNVFSVIEGVQQYGAGVLIWLWVGGLLGRYLKFWELYLALRHKQHDEDFSGGFIYIKAIFSRYGKILAGMFSIFLGIYCMEMYQYVTLSQLVVGMINFYIPSTINYPMLYLIGIIIFGLLIFCHKRNRFIKSSKYLMQIFLWGYFGFLIILAIKNYYILPAVLGSIIKESFSWGNWYHKMFAIVAGIRIAIYSNDIAVGYEGLMQRYAKVNPQNYVEYSYNIIKSNILDLLVCTTSGLLALIYCHSKNIPLNGISSQNLVVNIFQELIPFGGYFVLTVLMFCAAFTTVSTYLQAGSLLIEYYYHWLPTKQYTFYILSFPIFLTALSYNTSFLYGIMGLAGGILVFLNCCTTIYEVTKFKKNS